MLNMMPVVGSGEVGMAYTHFSLWTEGKIAFTGLVIPPVANDYSTQ